MNKWRKELMEFLHECRYEFLAEDDKILAYKWNPINPSTTYYGFVIKEEEKTICIFGDEVYIRKMFVDKFLHIPEMVNWKDVWEPMGKCRFDYKNIKNLKKIYAGILFSRI